MGLFGEKEVCAICGGKPGIFKTKLKDGVLCAECMKMCSYGISSIGSKTITDIREHINYRKDNVAKLEAFNETDGFDYYIKIDNGNKTFILPVNKKYMERGADVFSFSELTDYELIEDGETITKGGFGTAVAGGILFGGVGAIVGGGLGKKKNED